MKKHAASHGLAVLVCTVTAGILIRMGREYYPQVAQRLEGFAEFIASKFNISYSTEIVSGVTLAVVLAAIWGIAFSFMHSDTKRE